ncbi:drug/metabolite transporter (DMT)-like permease [Lysinibacillus composti]|uniref:DMT family transporter n=1 Tax=Lysinibacillus composti TaxID=720633 RepID=A0A3N9UEI8_9BACI|nr:DMT family transporter [Lysinibacillus composti]MBM7608741.1 drug/metabolite transporter (DMT)-like permease [Lysinibacillus composti]RQW74650.1 DMT family transporter [Lysinibacillus composti]
MKFPPFVLLIIATLLWGGNFVIGRAVTGEIPPFTLAFLRWCLAFFVFLPICYKQLKRDWQQIKAHWPIVLVLALTGVAAFNTLVYIGVYSTTSINASLMNSTTPIFIYILSFIFLKERLTKYQIIGTAISLIGVIFILSGGSLESIQHFHFNKGDLIVLLAVFCWSIYSLLVKQYSDRLPGYSTFLVTIAIGAIMLLPFTFYEWSTLSGPIVWSGKTIGAILYVGILASIIAFLSWNKGVVQLGANRASIYLNFIPVFATIFATLFIGESLQLAQIIGGLAVICGVILTNRK